MDLKMTLEVTTVVPQSRVRCRKTSNFDKFCYVDVYVVFVRLHDFSCPPLKKLSGTLKADQQTLLYATAPLMVGTLQFNTCGIDNSEAKIVESYYILILSFIDRFLFVKKIGITSAYNTIKRWCVFALCLVY